jgi:pimeloyl-ACP methyl ester carboxylesterase
MMDMYLERHPSRSRRRDASPPVVLIHGLGGDRSTWKHVIDGITEFYDVVVVEVPGFGRSRPLPADVTPTPRALAETVHGHLRANGIKRFHLVGHGLGGWLALEIGDLAPDGVVSVTGLCPAGFWPHPSGDRQRKAIRSARRWSAVVPLVFTLPFMRNGLLVGTLGGPGGLPYSDALEIMRAYGAADDYVRVNDAMLAEVYNVTRRLTPLAKRVPVFLVWAGDDRMVTPPKITPPEGVYQHVIPYAGHMPTFDEPERCVEVLLAAVDKGMMLTEAV